MSAPAPAPMVPIMPVKKTIAHKVHDGVLLGTSVLLIVGGLNWGSIALKQGDLVDKVLKNPKHARVVKGLVGLSALYCLWGLILHIYKSQQLKKKGIVYVD